VPAQAVVASTAAAPTAISFAAVLPMSFSFSDGGLTTLGR
jgi:hypothetical protein